MSLCRPCCRYCKPAACRWPASPPATPRSKTSSSLSPADTSARAKMDTRDSVGNALRGVPPAPGNASHRYWPIWHLTISRMRVFYREPAAVFWVYGFPLVMALSLGTAFHEDRKNKIAVDLVANVNAGAKLSEGEASQAPRSLLDIRDKLAANPDFEIHTLPTDDWHKRLQAGKTDLVIEILSGGEQAFQLWDEPHRTESRLARFAVEVTLLRSEQPQIQSPVLQHLVQLGSRSIDLPLPGR